VPAPDEGSSDTGRPIDAARDPAGDGANDGSRDARRWRVDFSLALFNRSGKYQIGQEIIADNAGLIDGVYYWRKRATTPPTGLTARLLGKAEQLEHGARMAASDRRCPAGRRKHRWLHLDPLTVLHRRPMRGDVVLVHDMGPLTHPSLFAPGVEKAYRFAYQILAQSAALPVFVSQTSQREYGNLFAQNARARVIYPPVAARLYSGNRIRPDQVGDRFLLTVGVIGARKNQVNAIRAFAQAGLAKKGFEYVMCGSREPGHEQVLELAAATPGVRVLSFVAEDQLRWLYANAAGFVLPSLLEGFGMPVAEALAFGLVPIVSQDSVLTEVAGDAALHIDPHNIGSIAAAMLQLIALPDDDLARRRQAMDAQLASFSHGGFLQAWRALMSDAG